MALTSEHGDKAVWRFIIMASKHFEKISFVQPHYKVYFINLPSALIARKKTR